VPTYQYACTECDHAFEQAQSFTDDALTRCPRCEGRLRKVFNAVGVVFKGSGFYRTDSRSEPKASSTTSSNDSSGNSSGNSSGGSSGDSKPAPTSSSSEGSAA
jgi:putative FmdB family regulatory protein